MEKFELLIENGWLTKEDIKPFLNDINWCIDNRETPVDKNDIFNALLGLTSEKTSAVIVGQDPYPNGEKAHGLAFSYKDGSLNASDSLKNIFTKISNFEDNNSFYTNLSSWKEQGVLLLNTALTFNHDNQAEHIKKWKPIVNLIIKNLINKKIKSEQPLFIMLWGSKANKLTPLTIAKEKKLNTKYIKISRSSHPSNKYGASKKFLDVNYQPFKECNKFLNSFDKSKEINWIPKR